MKKKVKLLSVICLLLIIPFMFACKFNPSHYLNDYGVCKQCGDDMSISLNRNNNLEYVIEDVYCTTNDYTYFKFVSSGEENFTIYIEEQTAKIDDINCLKFYTKQIHNISLSHLVGEHKWNGIQPLTAGETYYLRIQVKTAGTIKVIVQPDI